MKKNKWTRLGLGVCLLGMLFIFQGTSTDHFSECALCFLAEAKGLGYLQINNNTPYNILVLIRGGKKGNVGPYTIKTTPSYIRTDLYNGTYQVIAYVLSPIDQTPVYYKAYSVDVPTGFKTISLTVTTPIGYIPVAK